MWLERFERFGRVECLGVPPLRAKSGAFGRDDEAFLDVLVFEGRGQTLRKMRLRQRSQLGRKQAATTAMAKASEVTFVLPLRAKR